VIGLGQPVLDAVLHADSIEDVGSQEAAAGAVPVLGQVGKGHAVVGEHGVDLIGEDLHGVAEEGRALHLARAVVELVWSAYVAPPTLQTRAVPMMARWKS
jgi:hypothetical protein